MTSHFTLSLHVLGFLAWTTDRRCGAVTSRQLAESIDTNPVVVRRLLGDLRRAGLIKTRRGAGGGISLAVAPEAITLRHVFEAVQEGPLLTGHPGPPDQGCFVGGHIEAVLAGHFQEAEEALRQQLSAVTIADVYRQVAAQAYACRCGQPLAPPPTDFQQANGV